MMAYVQVMSDEVANLKKALAKLPAAVALQNKPYLQEEQQAIVKAEVSRFAGSIK
jgi:hypothetical protein